MLGSSTIMVADCPRCWLLTTFMCMLTELVCLLLCRPPAFCLFYLDFMVLKPLIQLCQRTVIGFLLGPYLGSLWAFQMIGSLPCHFVNYDSRSSSRILPISNHYCRDDYLGLYELVVVITHQTSSSPMVDIQLFALRRALMAFSDLVWNPLYFGRSRNFV